MFEKNQNFIQENTITKTRVLIHVLSKNLKKTKKSKGKGM